MKEYGILLDTTYCTGCNTCGYRCVQEFRYHEQAAKGLFRTFVKINDEGMYHKRCMHCLDPQCAAVCPVKAMTKSEYGPVLYNAETCIGCEACVNACPFSVPQFDRAKSKVVKCSMCAQRTGEGKQPACVEVCPTGALQFGEYKAILAQARERATKGKLKTFGAEENGGTHLIVLTRADAIAIGYPKVEKVKKAKAKKASMEAGLAAPALAALAYTGFKKFTERKERIASEKEGK